MPTRRPACTRDDEEHQVRGEEQRDPRDQPHAVDARGERAVRRHEDEQEQRLARRRVALDFGAALAEDEHLARGLEHVVGREQQEHQERHEQRAAASC